MMRVARAGERKAPRPKSSELSHVWSTHAFSWFSSSGCGVRFGFQERSVSSYYLKAYFLQVSDFRAQASGSAALSSRFRV